MKLSFSIAINGRELETCEELRKLHALLSVYLSTPITQEVPTLPRRARPQRTRQPLVGGGSIAGRAFAALSAIPQPASVEDVRAEMLRQGWDAANGELTTQRLTNALMVSVYSRRAIKAGRGLYCVADQST